MDRGGSCSHGEPRRGPNLAGTDLNSAVRAAVVDECLCGFWHFSRIVALFV